MAQTPEGALKVAAKKAGVSVEEYRRRQASGLKHCVRCRGWHELSAFGRDRTRHDGLAPSCRESIGKWNRERYSPKARTKPPGPPPNPPRDGDKLQARQRVNVLVRTGKLVNPNEIGCVECGHMGDDRRHEYDHYLGYAAEHHLDVEVVCSVCHSRRQVERGEYVRVRGANGRFTVNPERRSQP
jgi:hypothetical protein